MTSVPWCHLSRVVIGLCTRLLQRKRAFSDVYWQLYIVVVVVIVVLEGRRDPCW